jgi:hypothetical protein
MHNVLHQLLQCIMIRCNSRNILPDFLDLLGLNTPFPDFILLALKLGDVAE